MEKNNDRANLMVRRHALQVLGAGLAAAGGLLVGQGCNRSGGGSAAGGGSGAAGPGGGSASCRDKVPSDEAAETLRKSLQYKEKSDAPGKKCSICAQYEAERFTALGCGGCKLFGGAVNPEGLCLSFAPLNAPPAAGAAPAAPAPT